MQVMPDTGRVMGVADARQLYDPRTNIHAGTAYLKYLMRNYDTMEKVLAAYNAGPGNVRKYNGVPPFSETRRYVHEVKKLYVATSGG
jgi:soluble lytic murein transglycosylase-like protein